MNNLTSMLFVLSMLAPREQVDILADQYGVNRDLARCICQHESEWNPEAVSLDGQYVGLWQWELESFRSVRGEMGKNSAVDLRADAIASTEAALWTISQGHASWWPVAEHCEKLVTL